MKNKNGDTPLHSAILGGDEAVTELLIEKGAKLDTKNERGRTPLHLAAVLSESYLAEFSTSKDVDESNENMLFFSGREAVAKLHIEKGATADARDMDGLTPLHLAAANANRPVAELLIAEGADVNVRGKSGTTPLRLAVERNFDETAELLRQYGARE